MRTLAILPVKRFELAKTRLGEQLAAPQRRRLAEAMVSDVLDALLSVPELDAVVVTNEPAVASLASAAGATVLADPAESGQSAAALVGIAHALQGSYERALLVPGDCPALDGTALRVLLDRRSGAPAGNCAIADSGTVNNTRSGATAVTQKSTSPFFTSCAIRTELRPTTPEKGATIRDCSSARLADFRSASAAVSSAL